MQEVVKPFCIDKTFRSVHCVVCNQCISLKGSDSPLYPANSIWTPDDIPLTNYAFLVISC